MSYSNKEWNENGTDIISGDSIHFYFHTIVGIYDQPFILNSPIIFPNPASTQITISLPTTPEKNTFMTIYNINGQQLIQRQLTEQQIMLDVSELPQGIYFVKITDDTGVMVGKFVKQ